MGRVLSAATAILFIGISATVFSCGGAIVDDVSAAKRMTTNGSVDAAGAGYVVAKVAGEAAREAQVPVIEPSVGFDGYSYGTLGDWTRLGVNQEAVTLGFYYAEGSTPIMDDISNSTNLAVGGSLEDISASNGGVDVDKVLMKLEISTNRSFTDVSTSNIRISINTGDTKVAYATGADAIYTLAGSGSATLTNNKTIKIDTLTATVTSLGTSVTGDVQLTIPMDDMEYTVSCTFDATGCTDGTVSIATGAVAGVISQSGTETVYTVIGESTSTVISW